eukprot:CAMPEP_0197051676 /NCGR_PEP_ID=MMETSP1384-20130603/26274_1 /TAXON_ID=29189 /ORGANISM="Ammonia sp." /LENGTH=460 /DNA_ID=CAMNT_0042484271 /DNA_START=36 /DNA_END=1418 /DNA_ORIENTATION=-
MGSSCEGVCGDQPTNTAENTVDTVAKKPDRKRSRRASTTAKKEAGYDSDSDDASHSQVHHTAKESIDTDSDYASEPEAASATNTTHDHDVLDQSLSRDPVLDTDPYEPADAVEPSTEEIIEAFKRAVHSSKDALVMQLMDEYPSLELLNVPFADGDNALHVAVRNSSHTLILFLLNHGLSPNRQNTENGETALHAAVKTHDIRIVALMTKYKADPEITDNSHRTALQIAMENHDEDIIELLSPHAQQLVIQNLHTMDDAQQELMDNDEADIIDADILDEIEPDEPAEPEPVATTMTVGLKAGGSNKAPFAPLKRVNTQAALEDLAAISKKKKSLPVLEAWLEKKQDHMPYQWQRRWVIVRESHLLWSEVQRTIQDPKNVNERKKFNNSVSLMAIKEIVPVTSSKSQRKFIMRLERDGSKNKAKEYLWKCASQSDRDFWVDGLRAHIKNIKSVMQFLTTEK